MTPRNWTISSASWPPSTDAAWPPARLRRALPFPLLLALALGLPGRPAHAQAAPFGGTVALSSQLVDRGLPITPGTPVLQGDLHWSPRPGWSLGVAASTEWHSPGRLAEALAEVSRAWAVSDDWQVQGSLLYYDTPRRGRARPYHRVEANLTWIYRDVLTLNLSAFRPTGVRDARTEPAAEANLRWPLTRHLSLAAGLGVAGFQHAHGYYGAGETDYYRYGQAGLVFAAGRWRVELDRIATDNAPYPRRGTGGLSPWLATVAWSF
ncbi:hypothetical protein [Fulvimonas yonginensis]|uniref:Outer membrane protein n=1 Tax=Fulvimonas yonginensis TaxID=1495200 RepID=A0ABU8JAW1_9GAMM